MKQTSLPLTLLTLLAACGGGNSNDSTGTAEPDSLELTLSPCYEIVIDNLSGLTMSPSGLIAPGADFTISTLFPNGEGAPPGLDFGDIVISGHSSLAATNELIEYEGPMAAKDGISIDIGVGTGDASGIPLNIFVPEETGECEQPEYAYATAAGLPEHDTGSFPNSENPYAITEQDRVVRITLNPQPVETPVALSPDRLDGVLLNGVPIQMRESTCRYLRCDFGQPNPMAQPALYGMDDHNAHVLPDGSYHYHGDPDALYPEPATDGPTLIGLAADGYPIFGPWINDGGVIRKATSSYQMKTGLRTGFLVVDYYYDGTFVEDFEYVADSGDLDECNGMEVEGIYGYFVTDTFPYILNCFRGTPDPSFDITEE